MQLTADRLYAKQLAHRLRVETEFQDAWICNGALDGNGLFDDAVLSMPTTVPTLARPVIAGVSGFFGCGLKIYRQVQKRFQPELVFCNATGSGVYTAGKIVAVVSIRQSTYWMRATYFAGISFDFKFGHIRLQGQGIRSLMIVTLS